MASFPSTDDSLIVRTDFSGQSAWLRTREAVLAGTKMGSARTSK